jgi:hypothetical protein
MANTPIKLPKELVPGFSTTEKPTIPVEIDWSNPLSEELYAYIVPDNITPRIYGKIADGTNVTVGTIITKPTPAGLSITGNSTSNCIESSKTYPAISHSDDYTFFAHIYFDNFPNQNNYIIAYDNLAGLAIQNTGKPYFYDVSVRASSQVLTEGRTYTIVATRKGGTLKIYVDDVDTYSASNTVSRAASKLCFLAYNTAGNFSYIEGRHILSAGYARIGWTPEQVKSFAGNPYQLLKPAIESFVFVGGEAGEPTPITTVIGKEQLNLTGNTPTLSYNVETDKEQLNLTGNTPLVNISSDLVIGKEQLNLTGNTPTLSYSVETDKEQFNLTGNTPTLSYSVETNKEQLNLTGNTPLVNISTTVAVDKEQFNLIGNTPNLVYANVININKEQLNLTGNIPTLSYSTRTDKEQLTLTGNIPRIFAQNITRDYILFNLSIKQNHKIEVEL